MKKIGINSAIGKASLFLGVSLLMFGVLKFINPFHGWYSAQVELSGLPNHSFWLGIFSEISLGLALLLPFIIDDQKFNEKYKRGLLTLASIGVVGVMLVACYVHVHPDVPGEVLPLKIKPPFIPGVFIMVSGFNLFSLLEKKLIRLP